LSPGRTGGCVREWLAEQTAAFRDTVELVVIDDGVGPGRSDRRSGLANLQNRAATHGGQFDISAAKPRGTRLTWSVPLM
jgi:signal transduction histidine kinase